MSELSTEVDNLKLKYREVFLKVSEDFGHVLENIKPEEVSEFLDKTLKETWQNWIGLLKRREHYNCSGCAACCNLAVSEFSSLELKHKSENNDNFAKQFLSVFVPYKNEEDARKIYPEYFELLKEKAAGEKTYFYHCPKVTKDNRCPDYENRPQICKDFPDNPLAFLPKTCGFKNWKKSSEIEALRLQATIEVASFYKQKAEE